MSGIDQLLSVARTYASAEGVELSTVSWRALGDTKKLGALERGKDIQVGRLEKTMRWFANNWPADLPWPDGVERPVAECAEHPAPAPSTGSLATGRVA